MRVYYAREAITIYLGDCREVLPHVPVSDLLVTDPPYGVDYQSNFRDEKLRVIEGDGDGGWVRHALGMACDALRVGRHAYVFGPPEHLPDVLCARTELVWDKGLMGMGDLSSPWGASHETITFATHYTSPSERRNGRGKGAARLRRGSVLAFTRPHGRGVQRHPTEKPVPLLRRLVESSSLAGEVVLDPFLGSGSTLVAAIAEGRGGVGIEVDERYAEVAAERCERALDHAATSVGAYS